MSFDSTAVVNLLATASATSEIRAGELPCGAKIKDEKKTWQGELIKIAHSRSLKVGIIPDQNLKNNEMC